MRHIYFRVLCTLLAAFAVQGCSRPAESAAKTAPLTSSASSSGPSEADIKKMIADQNKPRPTACSLVTAPEMSVILGAAVQAEPHEGSVDKTECIYKPASAPSPYAELTIEWGEGETAMKAMGSMAKAEPGISNPYEGIGDQAVAVGTALMIRTGKDLVTITFSGVEDAPGKAKKIFTSAKAQM